VHLTLSAASFPKPITPTPAGGGRPSVWEKMGKQASWSNKNSKQAAINDVGSERKQTKQKFFKICFPVAICLLTFP